jgi:hypothetical protein
MKELKDIYETLNAELDPHFWNRFSEDNIYGCHQTAAFSKCFEFNLVVNTATENEDSYYLTPVMRGICEDLIVLKFLKKHKQLNADIVLNHLMMTQLIEICGKQESFFAKNQPQQMVFTFPNAVEELAIHQEALRNEWEKIGMKREKSFPSVAHMAVDAGLVQVYDYIYAATSDMVHFSPHILMRSGWSKSDDKLLHRFSMRNFNKYYRLFNQFYGSYLFVLFAETFKKSLGLSKPVLKQVKAISALLDDEFQWPELVTFEEMNVADAEKIRQMNVFRKGLIRIRKMNIG